MQTKSKRWNGKVMLILVCFILTTLQAEAAVPNRASLQPAKPKSMNIGSERQIGGQAGTGFSLLNVQKVQSKDGRIERLVFDIGNRNGYPMKGLPGYFNAQNKGRTITLDLAQMISSKVDEKILNGILRDSKFVSQARLIQDPLDQTLTLSLDLKSPVRMKTVQVKGQKQTARIVLDIIRK